MCLAHNTCVCVSVGSYGPKLHAALLYVASRCVALSVALLYFALHFFTLRCFPLCSSTLSLEREGFLLSPDSRSASQ